MAQHPQEITDEMIESADGYVERETRKFIERLRQEVTEKFGDPETVTTACFRDGRENEEGADFNLVMASKHVASAIGAIPC